MADQEAQLQAELDTVEKAMSTKEAAADISKYVKEHELKDPLINKQENDPYRASPSPGGCCTIA